MIPVDIFMLGTSAGVPSVDRSMPCIALRHKGKVILWDVGECCQRQMMKYKVGYGSIDSIFISHLHMDHFLGFYGLVETLRMTTEFGQGLRTLNVYAPNGFESILLNKWPFMNINTLNEKPISFDNFSITPFRVNHVGESFGFVFKADDEVKFIKEKADALGVKGPMFREIIEKGHITVNGKRINLEDISFVKKGIKISYTGDCVFDESMVESIKNSDVLIVDSTFDDSLREEADERRHMTAGDAGRLASLANVDTLILTHISARYKDDADTLVENASKHFKGNIILAYDGLHVEVRDHGKVIKY